MPLDLLLRREVNISLLLQSFAFHKLCGHKLWRDRSCPSRETVYKDRHANLVSIAAEFRSMSRQGVLLIQFKAITGFSFSPLSFPEFHCVSLSIQQGYLYPRGKRDTVRMNYFAYKHGAMTGSGPDAKPFNHERVYHTNHREPESLLRIWAHIPSNLRDRTSLAYHKITTSYKSRKKHSIILCISQHALEYLSF